MLSELHIENIAVIERADIEPGPGLNVLTGETGAGKSIVIDSLEAVLGARASRELVRTGAQRASVTAVLVKNRMMSGSTMSHRVVSAAQARSKNKMRRYFFR